MELPSRDRPRRASLRRAAGALGRRRGDRGRRRRGVRAHALELIRELGGEVDECELPHAVHGLSAYYVLAPAEASANLARYDGVRYGLRADGDGDLDRDVRADAGRGVRRRGEAADHARHLRALLGLLRRLLRPRPARPDQDRRGLPGRVRALRLPGHADLADRGLRARRADRRTRWRCTCPTTAPCRCRWPASRRSRSRPASRSPTAAAPSSRWASRSPRPAFGESGLLDAAHALERAIGFDARPPGVRT